MSMHSSSKLTSDSNEPTKKLSIKDRLGPIRNSSGDDRIKSSSKNNSKRKANDDSDSGFGKNRRNESYYSESGKDVRSANSRNSPIRNKKWLVKNKHLSSLLLNIRFLGENFGCN